MKLDDLKPVYRQSVRRGDENANVDEMIRSARRRAANFDQKIRRRDRREWVSVSLVVPTLLWLFYVEPSFLVRLGCIVVILASVQIALVLIHARRETAAAANDSLANFAKAQQNKIARQAWLLRYASDWYLMPVLLGATLILVGVTSSVTIITLWLFCVVLLVVGLTTIHRRMILQTLDPLMQQWHHVDSFEMNDQQHQSEISTPSFSKYKTMRTFNWIAMAFVMVVVAAWSVSDGTKNVDSQRDRILRFAQPMIDSGDTRALSVGVIHGDQTVVVHLGDAGNGIGQPDNDTIYEVGALTNIFTGMMLADLVIDETVKLEDPAIVAGCPLRFPQTEFEPIRWIDLATHRSGLPRLATNMGQYDESNPYADYRLDDASEFLAGFQPSEQPGTSDRFSNIGMSILGRMVSDLGGQSYSERMKDRVTEPLGMQRTMIELTPQAQASFAQAYLSSSAEASPWTFADLPGSGGVRSSLGDLLKFADAHLHPPEGRMGEVVDLAFEKHSPSIDGGVERGLGWVIARDGTTRWINGATGGFRSAMFINRDIDVAVIVLANTATAEVEGLAERLVQDAAGMDVEPVPVRTPVDVAIEDMRRLEGRYQLAPSFIFDVDVVDGEVMVGITNQPTQRVYAESADVWFYKSVDAQLHFDLSGDGAATSLTLHQNGIEQLAKRIGD